MIDIELNAHTQAVYREVNNRVRELSRGFGDAVPVEILCECGRHCVERIEVVPSEYDRVRRSSTYFFVRTGHEVAEVEETVTKRDGWSIVRNIGIAGQIANAAYFRWEKGIETVCPPPPSAPQS